MLDGMSFDGRTASFGPPDHVHDAAQMIVRALWVGFQAADRARDLIKSMRTGAQTCGVVGPGDAHAVVCVVPDLGFVEADVRQPVGTGPHPDKTSNRDDDVQRACRMRYNPAANVAEREGPTS